MCGELDSASRIVFSIDSPISETHEWMRGVKNCYYDTIQGINNLVEVGIFPQIIMTLI